MPHLATAEALDVVKVTLGNAASVPLFTPTVGFRPLLWRVVFRSAGSLSLTSFAVFPLTLLLLVGGKPLLREQRRLGIRINRVPAPDLLSGPANAAPPEAVLPITVPFVCVSPEAVLQGIKIPPLLLLGSNTPIRPGCSTLLVVDRGNAETADHFFATSKHKIAGVDVHGPGPLPLPAVASKTQSVAPAIRDTASVENRIPELGHDVFGFAERRWITAIIVVGGVDRKRRRTPEDEQAVKCRRSATLSKAIGDVLVTRKAVARGFAELIRDLKRI
jgi:hypothetical protein